MYVIILRYNCIMGLYTSGFATETAMYHDTRALTQFPILSCGFSLMNRFLENPSDNNRTA